MVNLTTEETQTVVHALRVAAEVYRNDQKKVIGEPGGVRLSEAFKYQTEKVEALVAKLENN